MSKLDRRNQAKQKRLNQHREHVKATSLFSGRDAAPKIVAVIPLSSDVSVSAAVRRLNDGLDIDQEVPEVGVSVSEVERFKQKVQFLLTRRLLTDALDACRVADFVLFVLSATEEVDELGELILRSVESQGISTTFAMAQVRL
jgi:pre-rRNA-processing protein TSR1